MAVGERWDKVSDHLRYWKVDRAKYVRVTFKESIDGADPTAINLSAATANVRLRIWRPTETLGNQTTSYYLWNAQMDEVNTGSDGKFDDWVTLTTTSVLPGEVTCELVIEDGAVTSQPTTTGNRERVALKWQAFVEDSVQP